MNNQAIDPAPNYKAASLRTLVIALTDTSINCDTEMVARIIVELRRRLTCEVGDKSHVDAYFDMRF